MTGVPGGKEIQFATDRLRPVVVDRRLIITRNMRSEIERTFRSGREGSVVVRARLYFFRRRTLTLGTLPGYHFSGLGWKDGEKYRGGAGGSQ